MTESEAELIAYLAEECAEVGHICMKILRHGSDSADPTKENPPTNRQLLEAELGNVRIATRMLTKARMINKNAIRKAAEQRLLQPFYLHHNTALEARR